MLRNKLNPLAFAASLATAFALPTTAHATEDGLERGEDSGLPIAGDCHLDPITCAVDLIGGELSDRAESGDCTGLGPEGCLGLLLTKIMCAIDNREIAKIACGPAQEGSSAASWTPLFAAGKEGIPVVLNDSADASWALGAYLSSFNRGEFVFKQRTKPVVIGYRMARYQQNPEEGNWYAVLNVGSKNSSERFKLIVGGSKVSKVVGPPRNAVKGRAPASSRCGRASGSGNTAREPRQCPPAKPTRSL